MIYNIQPSPRFDKKFKKLVKKNVEIKSKVGKFLHLLASNPKYPSLKSHQINHSEFGKVWSSWVHDDLRVLWKHEGEVIVILLLDIGSHDEVY